MTTMTQYPAGTFCWVDLSAHDMPAAADWYGALFGWTLDRQDTSGGPPYAQFRKGDGLVAGIGQMNDEMKAQMPPVWNSYVSVEDCEATVEKARGLGASVLFPTMKVMEAGWLAFLTDPTGATFALWQPGEHCGATTVNEPGSFCWNELATRDLAAACDFYGELFGWESEPIESGAPSETRQFTNQGRPNGHGIQMTAEWEGIPPMWSVYFAVRDTDATVAEIERTGGSVKVPPMDIPPGRFAVVADPQGAHFQIIELAS